MSTVSLITPESMANCFRSCVKTANEHARKKVSAANKVLFSSEETESQRDTLIFNFKAHRFNFLNLATLVTVSLIALNPYIGIALTAVALFARAVYNKAADPRTALSDQSKKTHRVWGPTEVRLGSLVLYKYNLATRFRDDLECLDMLHNLDAPFATRKEPNEPNEPFEPLFNSDFPSHAERPCAERSCDSEPQSPAHSDLSLEDFHESERRLSEEAAASRLSPAPSRSRTRSGLRQPPRELATHDPKSKHDPSKADFKEAPLPGSSGAGTKLRPKGE